MPDLPGLYIFGGKTVIFFFLHFFKQLETLGFVILILQKYKSKRLMLDEMNQSASELPITFQFINLLYLGPISRKRD